MPPKRPRIDKSVLTFGEPRREDKPKYRATFNGETCWNCGGTHGVVGAHIRAGHEGAGSLKPSDELIVPLCFTCHADQEAHPGPWWWLDMVKNMARRRFQAWRDSPARTVLSQNPVSPPVAEVERTSDTSQPAASKTADTTTRADLGAE